MSELLIEMKIEGRASQSASIAYADCSAMPSTSQIPDVAALIPGRAGRAVRLEALLQKTGNLDAAKFLNLASRDPAFAVSVPLAEANGAVLIYSLGDGPLPEAKGGPFRLLIPGHADECVNVKQLARIELSDRPGRDTRPKDDAEHAKLHRKQK